MPYHGRAETEKYPHSLSLAAWNLKVQHNAKIINLHVNSHIHINKKNKPKRKISFNQILNVKYID